jgi:hypothetical protein
LAGQNWVPEIRKGIRDDREMTSPMIDGVPGPAAPVTGPAPSPPGAPVAVQIWLQGVFPAGTGEYARRVIGAVLGQAAEPVWAVRVRLRVHWDPAVHFPVVAQGSLVLGGRPLRAQVHGATADQAIDLLQTRLLPQLRPVSAGAQLPSKPWVARFPRPPRTRQIVRFKPVWSVVLGVDQAVAELQRRDYDFYLFTEAGTRQDSVVYPAGVAGYRLVQTFPDPGRLAPHTAALTCYERPAPQLTVADAAKWLGWCEVPFLFFLDVDRRRGSALYRRYDGHYGLIRVRAPIRDAGNRCTG